MRRFPDTTYGSRSAYSELHLLECAYCEEGCVYVQTYGATPAEANAEPRILVVCERCRCEEFPEGWDNVAPEHEDATYDIAQGGEAA